MAMRLPPSHTKIQHHERYLFQRKLIDAIKQTLFEMGFPSVGLVPASGHRTAPMDGRQFV